MQRYEPYPSCKRSYDHIDSHQYINHHRSLERITDGTSLQYAMASQPTPLNVTSGDQQHSRQIFRCRNRTIAEEIRNSSTALYSSIDHHIQTSHQQLQHSGGITPDNGITTEGGSIQPCRPSATQAGNPFNFPVPLPHEISDHYNCAQSFIRRRNERERERVRCVNQGYDSLRKCLPLPARDKRISKVEILRSAIRYIDSLQDVLGVKESHNVSLLGSPSSAKIKAESDENYSSVNKKL